MKYHACLLRGRELSNLAALSLLAWTPYCLLALLARIAMAIIFWLSGPTGVAGGMVLKQDTCVLLIEPLPWMQTELLAQCMTYAEHVFPVLLLLGLLTRFSAIALLGILLITQVFLLPDAWPTHLSWAVLLLLLISRGAGRISLDHALGLH